MSSKPLGDTQHLCNRIEQTLQKFVEEDDCPDMLAAIHKAVASARRFDAGEKVPVREYCIICNYAYNWGTFAYGGYNRYAVPLIIRAAAYAVEAARVREFCVPQAEQYREFANACLTDIEKFYPDFSISHKLVKERDNGT
jgi:hypothetical protein